MESNGRVAPRGRPPKFGRPASLLALTLPQDTIEYLQALDPDIAWAIVRLADGTRERDDLVEEGTGPPDVELVPIGPRQYLIVVAHEAFVNLPEVSLVPLGQGRAFLAFPRRSTIQTLELAVIDRLEDQSIPGEQRARFAAFRDVLRSWRRDQSLTFHERSIVVVERRDQRSVSPVR